MSDLRFLAALASPALGTYDEARVAGRTWAWTNYGFTDELGIEFDFTDCDIVCEVIDRSTEEVILTIEGVGAADGSFTLDVSAAESAGLADDYPRQNGRRAGWACSITRGAESVQVWGDWSSDFIIYAG